MRQGLTRASALSLFGVYFFLFIFFMWPVVDLFSNTWPIQAANIQWRVGFMGLLTAYLHNPVLALVLAMILAFALAHRRTLRFLAVFSSLGAFALLTGMVLFALDAIQVRAGVPDENLAVFNTGTILTELKFFTSFLVLLFLGWGGWKTAGRLPGRSAPGDRSQRTADVLKAQKREG